MKYIFKILTLLLMLNAQVLYAESNSDKADKLYNQAQELYAQKKYKEAISLYKESYTLNPNKDIPVNIGSAYDEIKNYEEAIEWYRIGVEEFSEKKSAYNLGLLYDEKLQNFKEAKRWYEQSYKMGNSWGGYNLALLFENEQNIPEAIKWYKKAIEKGHVSAIKNLGYLYRTEKKDNLLGSAYMIGLIDKKYSKEKVFDYLRNKLKIDEVTLKKAYELQKTLVPNPYTGGVD